MTVAQMQPGGGDRLRQAAAGGFQLRAVEIQSNQAAVRRGPLEKRERVAAVAKRDIGDRFIWSGA